MLHIKRTQAVILRNA